MERGTVKGIQASFGSGIMTLTLENEDGKTVRVHGDSGPTGRALIHAFGREVCSGHTLLTDKLVGREVVYALDDFGFLAGLANADEVE